MNNREQSGGIEAELWIRSFAPVGGDERQEAAVDRLQNMADDGRLADLTVRMWGKKMRRSSAAAYTEEGQVVFDRVAEFREWAAGEGRDLEPFFEERTERCEFTDAEDSVVVLPSVALAEYRDDELVHLAPHVDDGEQVTVQERIQKLRGEDDADVSRTVVAAE
jgi:hypothetical protein